MRRFPQSPESRALVRDILRETRRRREWAEFAISLMALGGVVVMGAFLGLLLFVLMTGEFPR